MSYSVSGAISGIIMGRLHHYMPQTVLVYTGVVVSLALTLFLLFWERVPSFYAVFGFAVGWGLSDGVWQSLISG